MIKKIRILTCLAIVLIILGAAAAIAFVSAGDIDTVSDLTMSKNSSSSVEISWSEIKKADGYRIYIKDGGTGKYKKVADVSGEKNCSYVLKNLTPATIYNIGVSAFRNIADREYESEHKSTLSVYSLPDVLNVKANSSQEGVLSVNWTAQPNIAGYELQYSKNEDFSDAVDKDLKENRFTVKKLEPKDVYFVKARAYMSVNKKTVYGRWSEPVRVQIMKKYVMSKDIDPNKPIVALSFDDGPAFDEHGKNSTEQILDVLEEYGARATFFMCGSRINNSNKYLLKRELELGCELGNHTYDHKRYGKNVTAADIKKGSEAIKKASGQYPTIFRCPGGIMSDKIRKECKKEGMPISYWSVEPQDWKVRNADKIYKSVINNVYDGSIILMHDIYPTTAEAVKKIVPKLIEKGYQIVGVSEMITIKNNGKAPEAGQQYIDYNTINNNT